MNDIDHDFIDTISIERILKWRVAVQELIHVEFVVEFLLEHLWEIAWALFMTKIQPTAGAIDTRIKNLKKEVANLEAGHERLPFWCY